jgi:hypothetical protein
LIILLASRTAERGGTSCFASQKRSARALASELADALRLIITPTCRLITKKKPERKSFALGFLHYILHTRKSEAVIVPLWQKGK